MYYRCKKCNGATESKKGYPEQCSQCGHTEVVRAERIKIIVTGEFYRSEGRTWMLNDDRTKFWTK